MSQNFYTLLTKIGAAEWVNAEVGNTHVPVGYIAVGDGNGNPVTPNEDMTALVNEVHRLPITSVTAHPQNPAWLVFECVIPAAVGGWTIREIGLIGGSGNNKLLAVGNFPTTYKPLLPEGAVKDLTLRIIVQVANASVVQLTIDPSVVVATNQAIINAVAAHEARADPHPGQYIKTSQRGAANGVAPLGADNMVPLANLPPAIATDAELAASLAAHVDPLTDPHPQYLTANDLAAALEARRGIDFFYAQL